MSFISLTDPLQTHSYCMLLVRDQHFPAAAQAPQTS